MKVANGCKAFTVQMDEKLAARIQRVSSTKTAEFLRRAALDLVVKLEKEGKVELRNWNGPNYDGVRRNISSW